jgi:hypothetical protein
MFLPLLTFSQISFEAEYGYSGTYAKLSNSGYKFYVMDVPAQQCRIYNTNHSIWKTINLDVPADHYLYDVRYVSENLFTNDNTLSLCYIYYSYDVNNQYYTYTAKFIKENGTVLLSVEGCQYVYVNTVDDDTKMTLYVYDYSISPYTISTLVYDLPGQLVSSGEGSEFQVFNQQAFPNPARDYTIIPYELPESSHEGEIILTDSQGNTIQNYEVGRQFNDLMINTAQLPAGIYFYHLQSGNFRSEAKKIVVQ